MANKNIRSLSSRKGLEDNLFENIAELSSKQASEKEFEELAKRFMIDDSVVFGTASFYDFIRKENRAKKIHVCSGTACMVAGKQSEVSSKLKGHFKDEHIGHAACVGRCHSNNALMYNDKTFSISSDTNLDEIINSNATQQNDYHIESNSTPILTSKIKNVQNFYDLAANHSNKKTEAIEELKISNLRGRGGAGFPFWFKLDAVYKESNKQKYIVCNADEGDPGAYSDMYLMEHQPHKVLFGMYISGLITGANTGVLYIRGEYPDSIRIIANAIEEFNSLNKA